MSDSQNRINLLNQKLELLLQKQEHFAKELMVLYKEIEELKKTGFKDEKSTVEKTTEAKQREPLPSAPQQKEDEPKDVVKETFQEPIEPPKTKFTKQTPKIHLPKTKSNWEKFIGENLINKIGIIITVLGVAIGAKYSIENDLISPLTRIILGYLTGLGLLGFGIKLKAKYENYSAVLVSGALAILYFITFAAYSFYGLFPQMVAFALMLIFTIFGVVAAINYNKQIIAHIGLVGAYAIPYLLSNDSGNALILFAYMIIINIGVLVIAYKKYWKPLHYSSFIFTWLIYASWISFSYSKEEHFQLALITLFAFFVIFYVTLLVYKLKVSEEFKKSDIVLILFNSSIFYAFGYGILSFHETGKQLLGVFTLLNAVLHFIVSVIIYKKKLADRNLFYLISGLVLIFITIAIPVQLNGNWVTLLWATEAALLYWLGKHKKIAIYEYMSYPLMVLALFSLLHDWNLAYANYGHNEDSLRPILNSTFLTSLLFIVAFGIINWVNKKAEETQESYNRNTIGKVMTIAIPGILIFVLFSAFYLEIESYWQTKYYASELVINGADSYNLPVYNYDLKEIGQVWLLNYTLMFIAALAFINVNKFKNRILGIVTLAFGLVGLLLFLTSGLYVMSELRESHIDQVLTKNYETSAFNISIRYVAMVFLAVMLYAVHKLIRRPFMKIDFAIPFEIILHTTILWVVSSELLNIMDLMGSNESYKLGLSILWGLYALLLIILGIWKNKKYLRVAAIVLFGVTLIKLFFYDIASLNTISKTIVFVSLGILLLIISFLYNKYKHRISDESED